MKAQKILRKKTGAPASSKKEQLEREQAVALGMVLHEVSRWTRGELTAGQTLANLRKLLKP